jgi:hypothetical protein
MSRFTRVLMLVLALLLLATAGAVSRQAASTPPRHTAAASSAMPEVMAPVALAPVKAKAVAKPKPVVNRVPKPKPQPKHVVSLKPRTVSSPPPPVKPASSGSAEQRMMDAVARIPGAETAHWYLVAQDGYWGTADWYHDAIYISPTVPANRVYDVVAHEWAHLISVKAYSNVNEAMAAMNARFGGSGVQGSERAADCMAKQLGASWTHYTPCSDADWQAAGAELLAGHRL